MKFESTLLIIALFSFSFLTAQTKNEKESRISLNEFPENAQTLIYTIKSNVKRIRYYKETDGDKQSFETKFKYKKHWYSIEFDSSGILEDIEITINKKVLKSVTKDNIYYYLEANSDKFDIIKIQEQYLYKNNTSEAEFINSILKNRDNISSNYEIIVALKTSKFWELKEITFSATGEFLSIRTLQQDSYEYILY